MKDEKELKEISKKLDKLIELMEDIKNKEHHQHFYPQPKREHLPGTPWDKYYCSTWRNK